MSLTTLAARGSTALKAAIAMMVVLFALFPLLVGALLYSEWTRALENGRQSAVAAARVVATNGNWITQLSDQALERVDQALGQSIDPVSQETAAVLADAVSSLPGSAKLYVVAADGRTLFSTDPDLDAVDIRDREYFLALEEGAETFISGLLTSRINGSQIFAISHRIERAGRFAGAAIISYEASILAEVWRSLGASEDAVIAFTRGDGAVVARYPIAPGMVDQRTLPLLEDRAFEGDDGSFTRTSALEDLERVVAYQRIAGTPLHAVAALDTQSTLAPFRTGVARALLLGIPVAIGFALGIGFIARLLQFDAARREALEIALAENRMLVRDTHHRVKNNLQAIMSMVRMHPIPDALKRDLQVRIAAMSAVHEHLYRLDRFTEISAQTLLPDIADRLRDSFGMATALTYDIDPIGIDHDHATPLALLVSELVTNALKHAFADGTGGTIHIAFKAEQAEDLVLSVSDDGAGRGGGGGGKFERPGGLGSRLIAAMLTQLGGTGHYAPQPRGTRYVATLPASIQPPRTNALP